ncbi:MAG: hypothetical protein KAI02_06525, partial [Gammaproteobacteria bacterium]|nr:hypothetical protein [Gammaproteobacteria bacterium]
MFNWIRENSTAFSFAVFFHLLLLIFLFINWPMDKPKKIILKKENHIQVTTVNMNDYVEKVNNIKQQKITEQRKREALTRKKLEEKRQADKKRKL